MGVERSTLFFDIFARLRGGGLKDLARDAEHAEDALEDLDDVNTRLAKATPDSLRALRAQRDGLKGVSDEAYKARHALQGLGSGRGGRHRLEDLLPDGDGRKAGLSLGTRIGAAITRGIGNGLIDASGMIGRALTHLPPQAQAGIALAGAAAGAGVGAAVNGALLAALSTGTVAAGVALAARDTRVKRAAVDLGTTLLDGLTDAADGFVEPTLRSIGIVRAEFADMGGDLRRLFDAGAGYVEPLTRGLTGLVREALPGLTEGVRNSGPVVDALADSFVQMGESVGDAFAIMSTGSEGAAQGLRDLVTIADFTLRTFATGVAVASKVWEVAGAGISPVLAGLTAWLRENSSATDANTAAAERAREAQRELREAYLRSGEAAVVTAGQAEAWNQVMADMPGQVLSAEQAVLRAEQAYLNLGKAIKEANEDGKVTKEEALALKAGLLDYAGAMQTAAQTAADMSGSQESANAILDQGHAAFLKAAAGANIEAAAAKRLADKLFGIPGQRTTKYTVNKQQAEKDLADISRRADYAARDRFARIYYQGAISGSLGAVGQRPEFRAEGGPVTAGHAYVVGERRAEVFVPDRNGTIVPSIDRLGRPAGGGGRGSATQVVVNNYGVIGSRHEFEQMLAGALDSLKRKGRA